MMTEQRSLIELANERLSIISACNRLGMDIGDYMTVSMKLYCPFGDLYHADGGQSKAMRVYPETNSCFCFAGCGYFTPVKLIALDKDIPEEAAAERILDETGYVPPDFSSRWDALVEQTYQIDRDALSSALKVVCERVDPEWETNQFEDEISTTLRKCLSLLKKVNTEQEATKWLAITTEVMKKKLGEHRD